MPRAVVTVFLLGLLAGTSLAAEVTFALTGDNTKITFVGSKPVGKHEGGFKELTGKASVDPADVTTLKINVDIDTQTIYSDHKLLTAHLKSSDFFSVKKYPKAKFVSTKVEKSGNSYTVTGKLTLLGKVRDVSFPARIEAGGQSLTLSSNFTINRHNWGISFGKDKINDEVKIAIALRAKK